VSIEGNLERSFQVEEEQPAIVFAPIEATLSPPCFNRIVGKHNSSSSKEHVMKRNHRKLTLGRETLQKLDANAGNRVVGGVSMGTLCTSEWETCGASCLTRCSSCC
jgi:hypothetical protein